MLTFWSLSAWHGVAHGMPNTVGMETLDQDISPYISGRGGHVNKSRHSGARLLSLNPGFATFQLLASWIIY